MNFHTGDFLRMSSQRLFKSNARSLRRIVSVGCLAAQLAWGTTILARTDQESDPNDEPMPKTSAISNAYIPPVPGSEHARTGEETHPGEEDYPHILSTDVKDPTKFWFTDRPNLINQEVDEDWDALTLINTDRPDFTDVAGVVGPGVTQIETGYAYNYRSDRETRTITQTGPNSLLRVGTTKHFEWRMKWKGYSHSQVQDLATGDSATATGLSDLELGFKYILLDQDDWLPMQTIVPRINIPLGSLNFSANAVEPGFSYIYNWQIRKWWSVRGATGVDWQRQPEFELHGVGGLPVGPATLASHRNHTVEGHQSIVSYVQINKRVGVFTEWFMFYRQGAGDNRPDHFHDYGLYLYLTPNAQIDLRIGSRIGPRVDQYFTATGFSARW